MASGNILLKLGLDAAQFEKTLNTTSRNLERFSKKMERVGKNMSLYVTAPLVALGTAAVMSFDKQAKAVAQVEAALRSTGNAAGFTSKELQKMASDLQSKTIFGDEEILQKATAQLLTFPNIVGDSFSRAQTAAMDLASRLDGDLQSAAIMVGKALNMPVTGLTAMQRAGVQFSASQKEVIKSLVESGKMAEAQTIILDELNKQYGGSAEAAVTGAGAIKQLKNIWGDLMEMFGKIIVTYLDPLVKRLKELFLGFQSLSEETKKTIVVFAGIAAAMGPLTYGISKVIAMGAILSKVIVQVGKALKWLWGIIAANPVVAIIVAAVGVVIASIKALVDAWKVGVQWWENAWDNMKLATLSGKGFIVKTFQDMINSVIKLINGLSSKLGLGNLIKELDFSETLNKNQAAITRLKAEIAFNPNKSLMGVNKEFFGNIASNLTSVTRLFKGKTDEMIDTSADAVNAINSNLMNIGGMPDLSGINGTPKPENKDVNKIIKPETEGIEITAGAFQPEKKIAPIKTPAKTQWNEGTISTNEMAKAERQQFFEGDKINQLTQKWAEAAQKVKGVAINMSETVQQALGDMFSTFGESLGSLIAGTANVKSFFNGLLNVVLDFASSFGKALIAAGVAALAFDKLLINPVGAIIAGTALVALTSVVRGILNKGVSKNSGQASATGPTITSFASGGIVSAPTLAMVGDNRNARMDPEVIAPISKLSQIMGGNIQLTGELIARGDNLVAVIESVNKRKNVFR